MARARVVLTISVDVRCSFLAWNTLYAAKKISTKQQGGRGFSQQLVINNNVIMLF